MLFAGTKFLKFVNVIGTILRRCMIVKDHLSAKRFSLLGRREHICNSVSQFVEHGYPVKHLLLKNLKSLAMRYEY